MWFFKKKCNYFHHVDEPILIEMVCWTDIDGICKYCGKWKCKKCGKVFIVKGQTTGKWIENTFELR